MQHTNVVGPQPRMQLTSTFRARVVDHAHALTARLASMRRQRAAATHDEGVLKLFQRLVSILQVPVGKQLLNHLPGRQAGRRSGRITGNTCKTRAFGGTCQVCLCVGQRQGRAPRHVCRPAGCSRRGAAALAHPQLLARLAGALEDAVHILLRLLLEHTRQLLQHARRGGRRAHLPARGLGNAPSVR